MNKIKDDYLEYRDDVPETILDFKGLRKSIKEFKIDKAIDVLMSFYEETWNYNNKTYSRFLPTAAIDTVDIVDTGTHNIGIFSTALCLETIAAYAKNVDECKNIDGKLWVWEEGRNRRVTISDRRSADTTSPVENEKRQRTRERRVETKQHYGKERAHSHFRFIIDGLYGDFNVNLGFLARIATLVRFSNYLSHWEIKKHFIDQADEDVKEKF